MTAEKRYYIDGKLAPGDYSFLAITFNGLTITHHWMPDPADADTFTKGEAFAIIAALERIEANAILGMTVGAREA